MFFFIVLALGPEIIKISEFKNVLNFEHGSGNSK